VVTGNPLLGIRADRPNISTSAQSQVSVQHALAAALVTGKAGVEQFSDACVNDPRVVALRGKVQVLHDESFATVASAVEIATADGQVHKLLQRAARGSDDNPMTDQGLEQKLRDAASDWDASHDVGPLIDAIWHLDKAADVAKLPVLAVPRA
jgi:2-methylcitrate dehydratase PrpD